MSEVTCSGIHKPQELSVCLSHVTTNQARVGHILASQSSFLAGERGDRNELSVGRQSSLSAVFSLLEKNLLHVKDSRCSLK